MNEPPRVAPWQIEAKLKQIRASLEALLEQVKAQARKLAVPVGSALVAFAWLVAWVRDRRKRRRTIIEVRRA